MADRVKYDFDKELGLARLDLDKIEEQVETAQIQIIAHNHAPWNIAQCLDALEQAPGMLQQYNQPGRLLIDSVKSVFEEFIAQELAVYYQRKMQNKQIEELKNKKDGLVVAPAGAFDEVAAQRAKRKGN